MSNSEWSSRSEFGQMLALGPRAALLPRWLAAEAVAVTARCANEVALLRVPKGG